MALRGLELGGRETNRTQSVFAPLRPHSLVEQELEQAVHFNKIFAQTWFNEHQFITGSKDGKLALWTESPNDTSDFSYSLINLPPSQSAMPRTNGGIHGLHKSPSRRYLASGSTNPNEIAIFDTQSWRAIAVCVGHLDWVFNFVWVSETVLYSCSRDNTLKVWNFDFAEIEIENELGSIPRIDSGSTLAFHSDRVRAIEFDSNSQIVASLGTDSRLAFWNSNSADNILSLATRDTQEVIALKNDSKFGLWAIGGFEYCSLVDVR